LKGRKMTECTEAKYGTLDLVIKDLKLDPISKLEYQIHVAGKVVASGKTDAKGKGKADIKIGSKFEIHVKRKDGDFKKITQGTINTESCTATLKSPKKHIELSTDVDKPVHTVPEVKIEKVAVFQLRDIPSTMKKKGWSTAAKLMERWFNNPAWEMSIEQKEDRDGKLDLQQRTPKQIDTTTITMKWLLGFERADEARKELIEELEVKIIDGYEVRNSWPKWRNPIALRTLEKRLRRSLKFTHKRENFGYGLNAVQLHYESFLNGLPLGSKYDDFDDLYGALGRYSMRVAAAGYTEPVKDNRGNILRYNIYIEKVGLYIRDTYDFIGDTQPLGSWRFGGVKEGWIKNGFKVYVYDDPDIAINDTFREVKPGETPPDPYYSVKNKSYNDYRKMSQARNLKSAKTEKPPKGNGGDFVIYSDVKWYEDKKFNWTVQP
jgi:hypothetical protein